MPFKLRNSTDGIAPQHRLAFWMEGARCIGGMHVAPVAGRDFEGTTTFCPLGPVKICKIRAAGHDASWTRSLIHGSDDTFLRVLFQRTGSARIEQGSWAQSVEAGQWVVLDGASPHRIVADQSVEQLSLIVPRTALATATFERARPLTGPFPVFTGHALLLYRSLISILEDLGDDAAESDDELGHTLLQLFDIAIRERLAPRNATSVRATRLEQLRAHVLRNLADPELSAASIAAAMGCSTRYVYSLCQGGESISTLIWNARLDAASRDLAKSSLRDMSVSAIALSRGFRSAAHFSRAFRRRFGLPPNAYRQTLRR